MSGAVGFLGILLVLAAGAAVIWWYWQAEQKRRAFAQQVAAAAGLQVSVDDKYPPDHGFDLFDRGHGRKVKYLMWPAGTNDSVFVYRYETGSGKNERTWVFTCSIVELPFDAPHLRIGPEDFWSGLGNKIGIRDIEVESPEFNDVYRVRCDDERFAVTLLDHHMIGWMLDPMSGRGSVRFELLRDALLCVVDELPIRDMPAYLTWAQGVRGQLPAVLPSLYPPSR